MLEEKEEECVPKKHHCLTDGAVNMGDVSLIF